jgi:CspA family cold shock protein
MSEDRLQGTVRWFSRVKGYGFIQPDNQEEDVFVHFSAIRGEGYRNLKEGERVEFIIEDTPKGPQASDVSTVSSLGATPIDDTTSMDDTTPMDDTTLMD